MSWRLHTTDSNVDPFGARMRTGDRELFPEKGAASASVSDEKAANAFLFSGQEIRAELCDGAADLTEVLEYNAEQHGDPWGNVAVAYPGLCYRPNEGHAFVLVNRRQGSIKASARG